MPKKNKKIFLILAGGTCILNEQGHILSVQSADDIDDWLNQMPELKILADLEPIFVSGENDLVDVNLWHKLVEIISAKEDEAGGFVLISKIDQLINTSLALAFALQNFKKTIVLTSSQVSGTDFINKKEIINNLKNKHDGLTLRSNIINAIQIASQPLPSSAIIFGTRLIPSVKAQNSISQDLNLFASIDNEYWGKVDFGINVKSGLKYSQQKSKVFVDKLADIMVIDDIPGVAWSFDKNILSKYAGIFIKTDPYQAIDTNKQKQIAKWKMPVVLYNYNLASSIKGAVSISNCTQNTAMIKMMWALSGPNKDKNFEDLMTQNILGEFLN